MNERPCRVARQHRAAGARLALATLHAQWKYTTVHVSSCYHLPSRVGPVSSTRASCHRQQHSTPPPAPVRRPHRPRHLHCPSSRRPRGASIGCRCRSALLGFASLHLTSSPFTTTSPAKELSLPRCVEPNMYDRASVLWFAELCFFARCERQQVLVFAHGHSPGRSQPKEQCVRSPPARPSGRWAFLARRRGPSPKRSTRR